MAARFRGLIEEFGVSSRHARLAAVVVIAVVGLGLLAGCTTGGGPTVSDSQVTVTNETSGEEQVVSFEYSVTENATVLLTDKQGEPVTRTVVSPADNRGQIAVDGVQSGEYELVVQQDGARKTKTAVTLATARPTIQNVSTEWSANTIHTVSVTITNNGSTPLDVYNATYSAGGKTITVPSISRWIAANDSAVINLSSPTGPSLAVEQAGTINGSVAVTTSQGVLTATFNHSLAHPDISITRTKPTWRHNDLERMTVVVENKGDVTARTNVSVRHRNTTLKTSATRPIRAGETTRFEIATAGELYRATTGGTVTMDVLARSQVETERTRLSHHIKGTAVTVTSLVPSWQDGELHSVEVTAKNTGDVAARGTAAVDVNGQTVATRSVLIQGGTTEQFTVTNQHRPSEPLYGASGGGTQAVTVSISGQDWKDTATVRRTFTGASEYLTIGSTTFRPTETEDAAAFTGLWFSTQNHGDITINYDAVKISVDGVTTTVDLISPSTIAPGDSQTEYIHPNITINNGEHPATIKLLSNGTVVVTDTTTISTT